MLDNIPAEMRKYDSFVVWRYVDRGSEKPTKVPFSPITGQIANPTNPATWGSFSAACDAITHNPNLWAGVGFVLSDADPYAFIDLDDCKGDEFAIATQERIFKEFDSYAEVSPSGKGLHIIVKGSIPRGTRRSTIEIYSKDRYMTMTGQVYHNTGIYDRNELLNSLYSEMAKVESGEVFAGLPESHASDESIINTANNAANAEKFRDLFYDGNWGKYYPSQSEADYALVNIIGFYSQNAEQTKRIFLTSKLGQREKSRAYYRVARMLAQCFDRMLPPIDLSGLRDQLNKALEVKKESPVESAITLVENYQNLPMPLEMPEDAPLRPPGLLGDIAEYIYAQAPRPVAEIAVAAAIGLMSGICGKAYNISKSGLNTYIILLSATGTGKEAMNSGISKLMAEVKKNVPPALDFIGPSSIASEQALIKHLSNTSPCFVSIFGEFALTLKQMSAHNASPVMLGLQKMFLDMFHKSGQGNQLSQLIYSDKEKNTKIVEAPAFSILAETNPETFYHDALNEAMITGGLLPRFIVIENKKDRESLNQGSALVRPSHELVTTLSNLCANALGLQHAKKVMDVAVDDESVTLLDDIDKFCDSKIRGAKEVRRQLWNRVHLKIMKLAALAATGVNFYHPIITKECVEWAKAIVYKDTNNLSRQFETGEAGSDNEELRQITKAVEVIKEYIVSPFAKLEGYGVLAPMHSERVVPYGYLQKRLSQTAPFRKDRNGPTLSLKRTIETLIQRGDIAEVNRVDLVKKFSSSQRAFMITNTKAFGF